MRAVEERVIRAGLWLAIAAATVSLAASARPGRYIYDLDPGVEGNAFAWASTVATFAAALAAALHALVVPARGGRFAALAAIFAFLSLDDMVTVHERIGNKVFHDLIGLPLDVARQLQLTLYAPVFAAGVIILWAIARSERQRVAEVLLTGLGLLALAAAAEPAGIVTRRIGEGETGLANRMATAFEEAAEVSGWILIATALTAMLCAALVRLGSRE